MATAMKHDVEPQQDARPDGAKPAAPRRKLILPIIGVQVLVGLLWGFSKWN